MKQIHPQHAVFQAVASWLLLIGVPAFSLEPQSRATLQNEGDHPFVAAWERDLVGDEQGGKLLLEELQCLRCHSNEANPSSLQSKKSPELLQSAKHLDPDYLNHFIANPGNFLKGSTMPDLFADNATQAKSVEAIVHYLLQVSGNQFQAIPPDIAAVNRGEQLFHEVGCVACHAPQKNTTSVVAVAKEFPKLDAKYDHAGLRLFLASPLEHRPSGRMPDLNLNNREASDIAHYLLRKTRIQGALQYRLYYGRRRNLADPKPIELHRGGIIQNLNLNQIPKRLTDFTVELEGYLAIPKTGAYEFRISADDGARLWIDEREIINADSKSNINRAVTKTGKTELSQGQHTFRLSYFQRNKTSELKIQWASNDFEFHPIPSKQLSNFKEPVAEKTKWVINKEKARIGKKLFIEIGCNSCHPLQKTPVLNKPILQKLNLLQGCLADDPPSQKQIPDFHLSRQQKLSIRKFISTTKTTIQPTEDQALQLQQTQRRVHYRLAQLNCYACHQRNQQGGPLEDRLNFFTANAKDLGDEGSLPPLLTGVGDKLRPSWLTKVLHEARQVHSVRPRPYMNTRMPNFGSENLNTIAADLVQIDRVKNVKLAKPVDPPDRAKETARRLVDTKMLQCISCHTFNRHPSVGIQAMDLVRMPERLNRDWFHRYMLKPSRFRPGTRMPESFVGGKSFFPEELGGNAFRQIDAIWTYLGDGERAKFPSGMNRQSLELIVGGEAVVYRNKFREAGFRGIAVGHPERANLCLDAE
ncbi:MAG: PA14 domain-containing protein, partial [Planctomycetota bacterium]|nr:PA14 domain-containing protein [Planctomycetota bacterium]